MGKAFGIVDRATPCTSEETGLTLPIWPWCILQGVDLGKAVLWNLAMVDRDRDGREATDSGLSALPYVHDTRSAVG